MAHAALAADCLFCKIIRGEIPCLKLAENSGALAFVDIFPTAKGHCLVIPKVHAVKAHEMPEENFIAVAQLLSKVTRAVAAEVGPDYNILQNNGRIAHQEVMHAHFHVIPKPSEDKGLVFGGWPSQKGDQDELKALTESLRKHMQASE
jgi:diadenosine tetraphosphate (Ap4A) HIT family hydrolase